MTTDQELRAIIRDSTNSPLRTAERANRQAGSRGGGIGNVVSTDEPGRVGPAPVIDKRQPERAVWPGELGLASATVADGPSRAGDAGMTERG